MLIYNFFIKNMYSPDSLQKINAPKAPEIKEEIVYVKDDILSEEQEYVDPIEKGIQHMSMHAATGVIILEVDKDSGRARVLYGLGSQSKEEWKELWVPANKLAL